MKHLFSILLSASLLFTGCYCTLDERTDEPHFKSRARSISSYHTFDIEYAKGLRKEQVSNRTVTVTDSNGERMQTEIEVLDGKEIRIKPPRTGYKKDVATSSTFGIQSTPGKKYIRIRFGNEPSLSTADSQGSFLFRASWKNGITHRDDAIDHKNESPQL